MLLEELVSEVVYECDKLTILLENKSVKIRIRNSGGAMSGITSGTSVPNDTLAVGAISGLASKQIRRNLSRRSNTLHFYAEDIIDKRLYELVVKDLVSTGKYKQVRRTPIAGGGIVWELRRI